MQQTANLHQFVAAGFDPKSIAPDRSSSVAKRRWPFDHIARRRAIPRNGRSVICHYAKQVCRRQIEKSPLAPIAMSLSTGLVGEFWADDGDYDEPDGDLPDGRVAGASG